MKMRISICLTFLSLSFSTASCDLTSASEHRNHLVPELLNDGWQVGSTERYNADTELLDSMLREVEAGNYVGIHSILIVKDGSLVLESYFEGYSRDAPHEIRSATKSIGSILTGIAIDKGYISSENVQIYRYFEDDYEPIDEWSIPFRKVEIRHLLSMVSGYDCDDLASNFSCEDGMHNSDDWIKYSLDLPFAHSPGNHWAYNSCSLSLVGEIVVQSSGMALERFADQFLFEPLGIKNYHWMHSPKGRAWIGGGAWMIPREMAKIGQLMLNRGVWSGKRLLSEEWVDKSTSLQSNPLNGVDYGYLWQRCEAYIGRELVSAFWASGNGGQYIIVLPGQDMVVVFTGGNFNSQLASQPFNILVEYILPAFMDPAPTDEKALSLDEKEKLVGTYRLDFEPAATSTITIHNNAIRLQSPDNELIDLVPYTPLLFAGVSEYGPIFVEFKVNDSGAIIGKIIYGCMQRFQFMRDPGL